MPRLPRREGSVIKETERPLGQDRPPRRPSWPQGIPLRGILLSLVAVLQLATSAAIALRPSPFRHPPQAVVSSPAIAFAKEAASPPAKTAAPGSAGKAMVRQASAGAKIIHVAPDSGKTAGSGIVIRDPATLGEAHFTHLPDRALIEESEMGPLPVRGPDGRRPFDVYARPWSGGSGPRIAIVIGGLGLSQTGTQNAIERLPGEITLAFAPQGNSLDRWMRMARDGGHELIMQVPLEPYDYPNVNPGRNTLTTTASPNQTLRELRWAMSRITNYTGIMNYMGARYTADKDAMKLLMQELGERGLLYLDDGTSSRSIAEQTAANNDVPFARADLVIDRTRDRDAILKQLNDLEEMAKANGSAIGTGSAFEVTVDTVSDWAKGITARGFEIVPISALADDPENNQVANGK
jgi:polysaccharide deacetylase 2 family uncharacterized protein YibQ